MSSVGVGNSRSPADVSVLTRPAVVVHPGNHPKGGVLPPTPPLLTRWNFILRGSVIDSRGYEEARSNLFTPDGLLSSASPKRRSREAPRGGESQDFLLPSLYTISI